MINPDYELDRLRWNLQAKNWEPRELDDIIDMAAEEINNIILDTVSNASASAISHAEIIGAQDFIFDMDIIQEGSLYFVRTRSGKTDYSIYRTENLPNLLKNAKTSKDGTRYKVIPIRDKRPKIGLSSFETMQEQQRQVDAARGAIIENNRNNRSDRANLLADQFRQSLTKTISGRRKEHAEETGPVSFRTATSNQDKTTQWVIPEIDRDMTQYLYDLNDRIKQTVEESVIRIIAFYEREYS